MSRPGSRSDHEVRYLIAPLRRLAPVVPSANGHGPLSAWANAVSDSSEPCVLLDTTAAVVAASPTFGELVRVPVAELVGVPLFETVLTVLDFNAGAPVPAEELSRVPPLVALSAGALARSLLRVRRRDGTSLTLDAVSSPLHGSPDGGIRGSVTFLHAI